MSDTLPCGHPTACDLPTIGCGWCDCRRELADTVSSLVRCERERDAEPASKVQATAQYQSLRIEASRLRKELADATAEVERLRARVAELEAGEKAAEQKQADAVKAVVAMLDLPTVVELEAGYLDIGAMQIPSNPMVLVPRADWDARPQWRDRPTCVGWWVQDITGMVGRRVFHVPAGELGNPLYYPPTRGVRYYGPIPAPEDK